MVNSKPSLSRALVKGKPTEDEKLLGITEEGATLRFTDSEPWRVLRIQGEFVEAIDALAGIGPAVSFFGGARLSRNDPNYSAAVELARRLGMHGLAIITGGGPGIMEAGNRGARLAGARSVGLCIELPFEQKTNEFVDLPLDFRYFFIRKVMFVKYSSAFVIFPGGFGTLDELSEALTLVQTGKIRGFPIILFDSSYWRGMLEWMSTTMRTRGLISQADLNLLLLCDTPDEVVEIVLSSLRGEEWREQQEEPARRQAAYALSGGEPEELD